MQVNGTSQDIDIVIVAMLGNASAGSLSDTKRVGLGEVALPVVGGGAGVEVIDHRPLRAAVGAVGQGLCFGERVCHLCGGEDTAVFIIPTQKDCLVAVGLLTARDALFGGTEVVIVEHIGLRDVHLIVRPFHTYRVACGIGNKEVVRRADVGVHIVPAEQRKCLLHIGSTVEQQTDSRCGGEVGQSVTGLVGNLVVPCHEVRHHKPFLIDAVHRHIHARHCLETVNHTLGLVVVTETEEVEVCRGDGRIAVVGQAAYDHGLAVLPIEVASHNGGTVRSLGTQCTARDVAHAGFALEFAVRTCREIVAEEHTEFVGRRSTTLREEEVEACIARNDHAVEVRRKFRNRLGGLAQFVHTTPCKERTEDKEVEMFHIDEVIIRSAEVIILIRKFVAGLSRVYRESVVNRLWIYKPYQAHHFSPTTFLISIQR